MSKKITNEALGRINITTFKQAPKQPIIIILDNVRSRNNVGSIFRTSDAFLIEKIILTGITPQPPHRDIYKTALGATDSVNWEYEKDILRVVDSLKKENFSVYAVEQVRSAVQLNNFNIKKNEKIGLVFGSEVGGVDQLVIDNCDGYIEIPQFGTKHSLNIAVSAGVVLWHLIAQLLE